MMVVGQLPNPRLAQALIDYCRGQGIALQMQQGEQGYLLLCHADDYHRAEAEFQQFIAEPEHDRYFAASWQNGDNNVGFNYGGGGFVAQLKEKAGPLTLFVLALCSVVWGAWNLGFAQVIFNATHFPADIAQLSDGELWRVFTPSLIHFSAAHAVFNLLWWWQLGGNIERHRGWVPLLTILLVAGTLPNVVQFFMTGPNFGGLSGVVYGLVGYCWIAGWRNPNSALALPKAHLGMLLLWLVLGFSGFMNMANGAHVGGLLVGMLQGWWDSRRYPTN